MYQVSFLDAAAKDLSHLDKPIAQRIINRIRWLSDNVDEIKHLSLSGNLAGLHKLRVGNYKIIYEILSKDQKIIIHLVGHRREIYKSR